LRGVDIFDCVFPTRLARHHAALLRTGRLNMVNAAYARDLQPIDPTCTCYTCQHYSRAYLRHLILAKEMLAATLLTIHNLQTLIHLAQEMRQAILAGEFDSFAAQWLASQDAGDS
jgi:queuine tRNA-ribosyltransferase